ncbi:putative HTH-type transcriptional regulator YvaV [Thalassobacillus devorans]|uniref:HTH-type transcriptional regulator n=1 Tax=Thalassobacillus devorans TaxID=279813 RepID=A0ABQ1NE21_9BACI|nr:helix-turn-helix domain-containing protein [Thalassobacillus devorans]NIK26972.1 DNA-binding transcriptional regulator GbsR (MarR family) [Thalassobacillus devorans]GGC73863.1 putative HTH-type transcriptional regulator YvaV [Thalassobacillus devorans]
MAPYSHTIEELHTQVIHEFSKTLEMFALTPTEARLFVTLYLHGEPMTLDEMSKALGKSKTSMSNGIKSLLDLNLVESVWKKGVRKDLYRADENLYRQFMTSYIQKWLDAANRQAHSLKQIESSIRKEVKQIEEPADMEKIEELHERLGEMIRFHRLITDNFKAMKPTAKDLV